MQEHEKTLLWLISVGALIGLSKVLVSDERLTFRLVLGRTILGSATTSIAGAVLLKIPDIELLPLLAIGSALGIMGSQFIEAWLRKQASKFGDKI